MSSAAELRPGVILNVWHHKEILFVHVCILISSGSGSTDVLLKIICSIRVLFQNNVLPAGVV